MISKNSVNKVLLIGHVGQDPETKYAPSGFTISTFSLATNEQWLDLEKNKKELLEEFEVTFGIGSLLLFFLLLFFK